MRLVVLLQRQQSTHHPLSREMLGQRIADNHSASWCDKPLLLGKSRCANEQRIWRDLTTIMLLSRKCCCCRVSR